MMIWCAAKEEKRRYRPFWMLAGGFGLFLLCMLLAAGSAVLALYAPYGEWISLGGCILAAAVGVMLALTPDSSVRPLLSAHLSSVGVDFGGRSVRGFAEAGFGSLGLLNGGLRFCF